MRFIIAEDLWEGVRAEREHEWQHALMDVNRKHDGNPPDVAVHRREDGGATLILDGLADGPREVALTFDMMRDHFRDYREVIARLARADLGSFGMRDFEALDMAKKGVHDEAGMRIRKALRPTQEALHSARAPHLHARRPRHKRPPGRPRPPPPTPWHPDLIRAPAPQAEEVRRPSASRRSSCPGASSTRAPSRTTSARSASASAKGCASASS